ncbi:MAG TPA: hypothetical protein VFY84_16330, partial [Jiangellales bacterium]|nr:hypothetical protein [Jiangellales bacterium]
LDAPANTKVHYADLPPDATDGRATRPFQTVLDCARTCRFDEVLAIADTAVRVRMITKPALIEAAARLRGAGSPQARRVAKLCDERSHSPLESALRALLIEAGLTFFEPQYVARAANRQVLAKVDLGDPHTGVLLEADSFLSTAIEANSSGMPVGTTSLLRTVSSSCASRTSTSSATRTGLLTPSNGPWPSGDG